MKHFFCLFSLCCVMMSCGESAETVYKPQSSGNINSVLVVTTNEMWESSVGAAIRSHITPAVYGLPQDEPQFNLQQVPPPVFSDFVKKNRTVLKIEFGTPSETKYYKDPYAKPQRMVVVKGQNITEVIEQLSINAERIIEVFKFEELKEKQRRIQKSLFRSESIQEQLQLKIQFPSAYRTAVNDNDFYWIRRDIKTGSVNLMLYTLPLETLSFEDPNLIQQIIGIRDSISKKYIPGQIDGTYMTTEDAYTPFMKATQISKNKAFETRSLWQVEGAFMSGPFVNYIIEDRQRGRYVVAEGFVFAPSEGKRDYIFELEAIIRSIQL